MLILLNFNVVLAAVAASVLIEMMVRLIQAEISQVDKGKGKLTLQRGSCSNTCKNSDSPIGLSCGLFLGSAGSADYAEHKHTTQRQCVLNKSQL